MTQRVKKLLAMQETQAGFLGREDPLEKEMATHSSILAWRIPWTEDSDGPQQLVHRVRKDEKDAFGFDKCEKKTEANSHYPWWEDNK